MGIFKARGCKVCGGNVLLDPTDSRQYAFCIRCGSVFQEKFDTVRRPLPAGQRVKANVILSGK